MDQRVRILVEEAKIPKTDEERQVFRDAARKAITEMQEKFIKEKNLEGVQAYNLEENMTQVNQGEQCRYVGI